MNKMKVLYGYSYFYSKAYPDIKKVNEKYFSVLRKAGFDVEGFCLTLNPPGPALSFASLDQMWRKRDRLLMKMYDELLRALDGKDVFINSSGINLHPEFVEKLPVFTIFQCFDDPESSEHLSKPVAYAYDLCLVGNVAEVQTYKTWGVKNAHWIPLGLFPGYYDPEITEEKLFASPRDISLFMLSDRLSPYRKDRMDYLDASFPNAHFYGNGWSRGMLTIGNELKFLRRAKIGPNVHNSTGPINFRLYVLPANGVLQICDNKKYLGKVYEVGKEVIGFDSIEECVDLCNYYIIHDEERLEIALAGWKRVMRDYTEVPIFSRVLALVEDTQNISKSRQTTPAHLLILQNNKFSVEWLCNKMNTLIQSVCNKTLTYLKRLMEAITKRHLGKNKEHMNSNLRTLFEKNTELLSRSQPQLAKRLSTADEYPKLSVKFSRDGQPIPVIKENLWSQLQIDDPALPDMSIIYQASPLYLQQRIIVFGFGFGYQIIALVKRGFSPIVYEPSLRLLKSAFMNVDLSSIIPFVTFLVEDEIPDIPRATTVLANPIISKMFPQRLESLSLKIDRWTPLHTQDLEEGVYYSSYRNVMCLKNPLDLAVYQALIYMIRPTLIIEIGTLRGGSALFFADILRIVGGEGRCIHTYDIDNNVAPEVLSDPNIFFHKGGHQIFDPSIIKPEDRILVIEDSSHTYENTVEVLDKFAPWVSLNSYLIVEDTMAGSSRPHLNGGPIKAIEEFIAKNDDFEIDDRWDKFYGLESSNCIRGFLRRRNG